MSRSGADPSVAAARERVAAVCRELAAAGLVHGTAGNVSERVGDVVAVTATGARLEAIDAAQVSVVDLDGRLVAGELEPTSELGLHLGVHRLPGTGAVVHTHAPLATALSCVLDELPAVHYEMLALGGPVPVVAYHTFGSPELAEAVVAALATRTAALLANHGAVARGHTLAAAVQNTRLLEWACDVYWHAACIGTPRTLSESDLAAVVQTIVARGYGTTKPTGEGN